MPNQIQLKDAEQDQEIVLLKHRVEQLEEGSDSKMVDELRERVRKLERTVWSAAAVVSAAITVISIAIAADARPAHSFVENGLSDSPCATELSSSIVEEVSIRPCLLYTSPSPRDRG